MQKQLSDHHNDENAQIHKPDPVAALPAQKDDNSIITIDPVNEPKGMTITFTPPTKEEEDAFHEKLKREITECMRTYTILEEFNVELTTSEFNNKWELFKQPKNVQKTIEV